MNKVVYQVFLGSDKANYGNVLFEDQKMARRYALEIVECGLDPVVVPRLISVDIAVRFDDKEGGSKP